MNARKNAYKIAIAITTATFIIEGGWFYVYVKNSNLENLGYEHYLGDGLLRYIIILRGDEK
jgi:hypothetical protein